MWIDLFTSGINILNLLQNDASVTVVTDSSIGVRAEFHALWTALSHKVKIGATTSEVLIASIDPQKTCFVVQNWKGCHGQNVFLKHLAVQNLVCQQSK